MVTNLKWNCEETNDDIGEREISNEEICHRLQKREMMMILERESQMFGWLDRA